LDALIYDRYWYDFLVDPAPYAKAEVKCTFGVSGDACGNNKIIVDGVDGTQFAVWAPDAERVSVVGNFCLWDGRRYPMRNRGASGVWEIFLPGIQAGEAYKFEIRGRRDGSVHLKSDPYARAGEHRPATASLVTTPARHRWRDGAWRKSHRERNWLHAPLSIYEVHLASWRRGPHGFPPRSRHPAPPRRSMAEIRRAFPSAWKIRS
jgi:1,4-alpha-glucan branching enzyme